MPLLVKDDGPALLKTVDGTEPLTLSVSFDLTAESQFDQAGAMVRVDECNWIKTGIEVVDGVPRLSCVVTKDGYSDWSTQILPEGHTTKAETDTVSVSLSMRVSQMGDGAYVIEYLDADGVYQFVRICQLCTAPSDVRLGVFACCPEAQRGCTARFTTFSVETGVHFEHDASGNLQ
ncbi:protein of unknown function DUF1349 [Kipferlia bialata]|uniref:DUF1349 domain-containing protein n=1 Tax=Kipferlia bialata TaxID=797122 RepID=A0A9K3GHM1_9EUKA|nr:protein of unknown function DUF1349 [Kipferlia bialata]|eukprot:g3819.t1